MNLAWKKSEPDLWNIYNLTLEQLQVLYPDCKHLRTTQLKYKREIDRGLIRMPEKHTFDGDLESERQEVNRRRGKAAPKVGKTALMRTIEVPEEHLWAHEALQKHLDDEGTVSKARFSQYQMGYKDSDGEAQVQDLKAARFEVAFDTEPKWPLITRVESKRLAKKESLKGPQDAKKAIILPDLQIPYHDEKAVEIALELVRDVKPDKIVLLGDLLDLDSFSKFTNIPLAKEFAKSTQQAIIDAHNLLTMLRQLAPRAEIVVLEGNHDRRMTDHTIKNNMAAYGLKRADKPESWPVLSVPFLCAFDTLDVEYISGYPANRYWINENLQVQHGHRVRSSGSTAKLVSDNERVSTIFGHVHRIETQYKTHPTYDGQKTNAAFSIGCLCRLDGAVPSKNRGVDLSGRPIGSENWQQAVCVVDYQDGNMPFNVTPVYINTFDGYRAVYNGKTYAYGP